MQNSDIMYKEGMANQAGSRNNALNGYCIIFGIFVSGLVTNVVVAAKIVEMGPLVLPASVFIWALTYPCSDIVAEVYGRDYANKMVLGGFVAFALAILTVQAAVLMPAAPFWANQEAFQLVLGTSLRVTVAAMISYLVTQFFDVYIFSLLRKRLQGKHLWIRNNGSTLVSQTLANTIFLSIAFLGTMQMDKWLDLYSNNLMVRYMLTLSDTALVYLGVAMLRHAFPELKNKNGIDA